MGFKTNKPAPTSTKPTTSASPAETAPRSPSRKPDYRLCVKVKEGDKNKFVRVGGMWKDDQGRNSFRIVLDDGVELTSTKEDRCKITAYVNDGDEKFNKDGTKK